MYFEGLRATLKLQKKDKTYRSAMLSINKQIVNVITMYLEQVGIIVEMDSGKTLAMSDDFRDHMIEDVVPKLEEIEDKLGKDKEVERIVQASIMATVIRWHGSKYGHPIHDNLLEPIMRVLLAMNIEVIKHMKILYKQMHRHTKKK